MRFGERAVLELHSNQSIERKKIWIPKENCCIKTFFSIFSSHLGICLLVTWIIWLTDICCSFYLDNLFKCQYWSPVSGHVFRMVLTQYWWSKFDEDSASFKRRLNMIVILQICIETDKRIQLVTTESFRGHPRSVCCLRLKCHWTSYVD